MVFKKIKHVPLTRAAFVWGLLRETEGTTIRLDSEKIIAAYDK